MNALVAERIAQLVVERRGVCAELAIVKETQVRPLEARIRAMDKTLDSVADDVESGQEHLALGEGDHAGESADHNA